MTLSLLNFSVKCICTRVTLPGRSSLSGSFLLSAPWGTRIVKVNYLARRENFIDKEICIPGLFSWVNDIRWLLRTSSSECR